MSVPLAEIRPRLHPTAPARTPYLERALAGRKGPYVAASDWVRPVQEQVRPWIPGRYVTLGTDGFGRSDTRPALRRHFEVDAEHVVVATLHALAKEGRHDAADVARAIHELGVSPEAPDPVLAESNRGNITCPRSRFRIWVRASSPGPSCRCSCAPATR